MNINGLNTDELINHFGERIYQALMDKIPVVIKQWQLCDLSFVNSYSANFLLSARSDLYGAVIVKFACYEREFFTEVNALRHFKGTSFIELLAVDLERQVLLLPQLVPGTPLSEEADLSKRLAVFTRAYQTIHRQAFTTSELFTGLNANYPTYLDWINRITRYMSTQRDWAVVYQHILQAQTLFADLWQAYPPIALLHGDFHYHNILKSNSSYLVIDPKGVIGHPIFDLSRYALNEYWDAPTFSKEATMTAVLKYLSHYFHFDYQTLKRLLYIECVLATCWCVQDGVELSKQAELLTEIQELHTFYQSTN